MKYLKADFLADVAKEAKALKKHATKEEIEKLNLEMLDPNDTRFCVYGQMTGDCQSPRASRLIQSCCKRYFDIDKKSLCESLDGMRVVKKMVNGKTVDVIKERRYALQHFSSIETYILLPNAKRENIVAYLKGETKDLVL